MANRDEPPVLVQPLGHLLVLILNRPRVLNSLTLEMLRDLRRVLEEARGEEALRLVLLKGAGEKGFCAGGDLKELAQAVQDDLYRADRFFQEEYALDLMIHQFPKPVVVLAHGIVMGGGLGLAAGADFIVATEHTRVAMPETRIGFFPDVGATGWLFQKCPPGYPEYLALTGYELTGGECVRVGLATHLVESARWQELQDRLRELAPDLPGDKARAVQKLARALEPFAEKGIQAYPELDAWVAEHFAGKTSLQEILASLQQCSLELQLCQDVLQRLEERSPTALALTLALLRANEGRPLAEVFRREALAAHFMVQHPDYREGIRARIIDKDDKPRWDPATIEEAEILGVEF
jgi:enoyl-CoA hydratase